MNTDVILAIDQGTTNTKALAVDQRGAVIAHASVRSDLSFPRPGWVESDPVVILEAARRAMADCLALVRDATVIGVAITNQRETAIAWDRATLQPLGPAVSWQCLRSAPLCDRLRADGHAQRVRTLTGLDLAPMFAAGKMAWLLDHIDHGRERAAAGSICLGTVDSWLVAGLTDGRSHVTDVTNASRTQLLDLDRLDWSDELLGMFDIPRAALPSVVSSAEILGSCTLPTGAVAPILSLIGDSHAAAVGHGAMWPGTVKATFGTGTSVLAPVPGALSAPVLSHTVAWSRRTHDEMEVVRALEGNIYATGAALDLCASLVGLGGDVSSLEGLVDPARGAASGVYFVPAMSGLGAPHWDATATGTIIGITRGTSAADLATAAFESIAFQVRDVLGALPEAAASRELCVDGGAMQSDRLAALVADVTGQVVLRTEATELSALGAAHLAGHVAGWWPDLADLERFRPASRVFEPSAARSWDDEYDTWSQAVGRSRGWNRPDASTASNETKVAS